ncbi:hypothetical protein EJB05_14170, partial [Eragrostis curvula]
MKSNILNRLHITFNFSWKVLIAIALTNEFSSFGFWSSRCFSSCTGLIDHRLEETEIYTLSQALCLRLLVEQMFS